MVKHSQYFLIQVSRKASISLCFIKTWINVSNRATIFCICFDSAWKKTCVLISIHLRIRSKINSTFSDHHSNRNCTAENFKRILPHRVPGNIYLGSLGKWLFSIYVFLQPYRKSTSVNIFMLNLATSDLLFTATLPFRVDYYLRGPIGYLGT